MINFLKKYKKALIILSITLVVIGIGIFVVLPKYTEYKIRQVLKEDNNFPYHIDFENFAMNIFAGNARMEFIKIEPDSTKQREESIQIQKANIEQIQLHSFSLRALYFENKIFTKGIEIVAPEFYLIQKKSSKEEKSESKSFRLALDNHIHIKDITIDKAQLHLTAEDSPQPEVELKNFNFQIKDIRVNEETLKNKIPFTYEDLQMSFDSLYYRFNPIYHLSANQTHIANTEFSIQNLCLGLNENMPKTQSLLEKESDIFQIKNGNIEAQGVQWNYQGDRLQIQVRKIGIEKMTTDIYRNFLPDDHQPSVFYSEKLRNLPFDLSVDSLSIKDNKLSYSEQENFQSSKNTLNFSQMNIDGTHIVGGAFVKEKTTTRLLAEALFMETGKTYVDWSFDASDPSDSFLFKGKIHDLQMEPFNPFITSEVRVKVSGVANDIDFTLRGNKYHCKGDMTLAYRDLQLTVLKKNGKEKNKFLSGVANLLVSEDKNQEKKSAAEIDNQREEPNSFFSFIWKSLFDGIKNTFL